MIAVSIKALKIILMLVALFIFVKTLEWEKEKFSINVYWLLVFIYWFLSILAG